MHILAEFADACDELQLLEPSSDLQSATEGMSDQPFSTHNHLRSWHGGSAELKQPFLPHPHTHTRTEPAGLLTKSSIIASATSSSWRCRSRLSASSASWDGTPSKINIRHSQLARGTAERRPTGEIVQTECQSSNAREHCVPLRVSSGAASSDRPPPPPPMKCLNDTEVLRIFEHMMHGDEEEQGEQRRKGGEEISRTRAHL